MDTLSIIALILATTGALLMYINTVAATIAAYASIVCACFCGAGGAVSVSADGLLFWGVAAVIVLGLQYLKTDNPFISRLSLAYVSSGALVGALLGLVSSHTPAYIICGSAIGALLGALAFTRTPSGRALGGNRSVLLDFIGAAALPAVVITGMSAVATSSILY
ncbi:MAG: hypothetical protein K2M06_08355 [Muribaculaceae bacterium]|nr:hypothetical protein [Muribaculaceae bacterium]